MKRVLAVAAVVLMFTGFAAAQTADLDLPAEAGIVKPGSALYGLEIAFENAIRSDAENVQDRAQEMKWARENNRTEAEEAARNQLGESVSAVASSNSTQGIDKAIAVIETLNDEGIATGVSLGNLQDARERVQAQVGTENGAAPDDVPPQ